MKYSLDYTHNYQKNILKDYHYSPIKEYEHIKEDYTNLTYIIGLYYDNKLDFTLTCPISLLEKQRNAMSDYLRVLEERLKVTNNS